MAYCAGCGSFVGDYSAYRRQMGGKGQLVLCYRCNRWADRHPGRTTFPSAEIHRQSEGKKIRSIAAIYTMSSLAIFVVGIALVLRGDRAGTWVLLLLGAISLFLIGLGMRRSIRK